MNDDLRIQLVGWHKNISSIQKGYVLGSKDDLEEIRPPIKRSKLYEDVDENIDCLALLPTNDMEIGKSKF